MSENIEDWTNEVHEGDAQAELEKMPGESVDMVITSPPYYNLRDYGKEGQIGTEDTVEEYIERLSQVFNEVYRVLKPTGNFYLNIGDTYSKGGEYPRKCKILVPHRVAISLIDNEGWICRNDNIWEKLNCIPDTATDRRSTKFELFFHFVKEQEYFYNPDPIREDYAESSKKRREYSFEGVNEYGSDSASNFSKENVAAGEGKVPGDIQKAATSNNSKAHFAPFPRKLIKPHIKSSCPKDGVVLDPFIGSGTTAIVAEELGRDWIGIDLNKDYVDMSYDRIEDETTKIFDDRSFMDY
jgi:DNA modification methylase